MIREWSQDGWLDWARRVDTPNFGERPRSTQISLVVIHNISLPPGDFGGGAVERFFTNRLDPAEHPYFATIADIRVSAHFFLRRTGELIQFVSVDKRAWHAGTSCWRGRENCNDYSIGVELEGVDEISYTPEQYEQLKRLLCALARRYPVCEIAGHCHVAPGRKTDPGPAFDWAFLRMEFPEWGFPEG